MCLIGKGVPAGFIASYTVLCILVYCRLKVLLKREIPQRSPASMPWCHVKNIKAASSKCLGRSLNTFFPLFD